MDKKHELTQYEIAQRKRKKAMILAIIAILPIGGLFYKILGENSYIGLSIIILILTFMPFFIIFEKRKPKAREVVLLVVLSSLTVVLHLGSHMIFPLQIGTALVFLWGASFGSESGFLIGALARFMCNFYMGQGVWTPWQMVCWGIIGFLGGLIFHSGDIEYHYLSDFTNVGKENQQTRKNDLGIVKFFAGVILFLCIGYIGFLIFGEKTESFFGYRVYIWTALGIIFAFAINRKKMKRTPLNMTVVLFALVVAVYGGIMNLSVIVNSGSLGNSEGFTLSGLRAIYVSGLGYDLFHGISAGVCVYFLGDNMVKKMERVKIKYGIYK